MTVIHSKEGPSAMIAYTALMTALAAVAGYLEMLFPIDLFGIPGVKLGLANAVSLIALFILGPLYAFLIMTVRVFLLGFMFGNMYSIIYGLAGGCLSIGLMCLLKRSGAFKMTGLSAAGGAAHNIGQLIVAFISFGSINLKYYMPLLVISGTIFGCLIGILAEMIYARIGKGGNNDRVFEGNA